MYELSRVRLYSIGPAGARYADTVLDLRGVGEPVPDPAPTQAEFFEEEPVGPPRRPAPAGVLFLENGGFDKETDRTSVILNLSLRFFGRSIAGEAVDTAPVRFTVEFVP